MAKQGNSYKEKLRIDIDHATLKANSFEEFLQLLAVQGYEIKQGKYLSFKHKDGQRFTMAKTIGEDYTKERIKELIKTKTPVKQPQQPSIRQLHDLSQDKFQNSKGLTHWRKIQNLKIMADTMNLTANLKLPTPHLTKYPSALKSNENRIKDLTKLQKQLRIYGRTKKLYGKFQQSRNKDKFIRETPSAESDVMLHETAKCYLSAYQKQHRKVPKLAELKPILAALKKEKSALYKQYKTSKAEQGELMKLHVNLQKILGAERYQQEQEVDR